MIAMAVSGTDTTVAGSIAVIVASVILFIQNHKQSKHTKEVKSSITENNGGSSVKDRFDKIDKQFQEQNALIADRLTTSEIRTINRLTAQDQRLFRIEGFLMGKHAESLEAKDE